MKKASEILSNVEYRVISVEKPDYLWIDDLVYDSRKARNGTAFFCLRGFTSDGHRYTDDAYRRGARLFICEEELSLPSDAVQILVSDSRRALATCSANFFDHPERSLKIIGVTGTKGKSSVTAMVFRALNQNGIPCGSIGTYGACIGDETLPTENSTPESYELFRFFDLMRKRGIENVVMEVSSQGIYLNRIFGIEFFACLMTNLSPDHIGPKEHPDFDHYKNCKKSLFDHCTYAVFNADDAYYAEFSSAKCIKKTFSVLQSADYQATDIEREKENNRFFVSFLCHHGDSHIPIRLPIPGVYSVYNALAAAALCELLGVSLKKFGRSVSSVAIPGRFEYVGKPGDDPIFILDYAHTGESLGSVLYSLYEYSPQRIICVFGSVGGRTELRRKELGEAAAEYADYSVITSDNPDWEDPARIAQDIAAHLDPEKYTIIPDREQAIRLAVEMAKPGDVVLFAGKGHETYQLVQGKKIPFSEKEVIIKALSEKSLV